MKPLGDCRLYAFVDSAYLRGRPAAGVVRALCEGGADIVQLRTKGADPEEIKRMAAQLLPITNLAGVHLVINDHWRVACEVGAPVCHLGQEDFFDAGFLRKSDLPGVGPLLGMSTHAADQAQRAIGAAADYVAVGPVFPTGTKPGRPAVTLDYVRWAAANVTIPWFAIGGITLENLSSVLDAGANRICVVSAILNATDITAACAEFRRRLPD